MIMKVFCCGEYCQEHPDVAEFITVNNSTDNRLTAMGQYICEKCKNR